MAITLGDPAGIGPEVALKAIASFPKNIHRQFILLGPEVFYEQLSAKLKLDLYFKPLNRHSDGRISCVFEGSLPKKIKRCRSVQNQTIAAVRSIELAVRLAMRNEIDAIVTPPINKAGLKKAGFNISGHTEYLAKLSNTSRFEMMLVGGPLRTVLVTRHLPIKDVPGSITAQRVEETILLTDLELRRSFGIRKPRLVVCGLNPHAGEQGTLGIEEIQAIAPGVLNAKKKTDALIVGPYSPDSLFYDAYIGRYDAEICMFHDQGLIPLKMISRGAGVNVTLGLPFIRTSPDHGTGYDIAKKFTADPGSMIEAIKLAYKISKNRRKYDAR
ncbi:MAG: 4-hydroxythreonine-4-phosphate dehydrogenase PdxA [Candidatus Omnitrophica bacterium CG1_02_46_14]|nr:MAG: 4-hydroxythreonine-4-phosphate dehydrogenase PdxA [Candidatus Omnitrophica bacterium CG1_02_46_14]